MKFLKILSVLVASSALIFITSCEPDESNPCPDAVITVDIDSANLTYTITAEGLEELLYEWYVNDNLVETEELDDTRNDRFDFQLEPGTYTICVRAESEICDEVIEFCLDVTIEAQCPELEFEYEAITNTEYLFEAEFDGIDGLLYTWYVDGDSIETIPADSNRTNLFDYSFEPGEHTVCIVANTDDCGELEYCEEIEVSDEVDCPELHFTIDPQSDNTFLFVADFEGRGDTQYKWLVNDDVVDKENFEGVETDHQLLKEFAPGTYNVCIIVETDRCEDVEFCEEIVVEAPECPELHFSTTQEGDNLFLFTADFEGKEAVSYKWYIGEDVVDKENFDNHDTDHQLLWDFLPGTYHVCIVAEIDGCEEVEFCEEITVEEECPELHFTATPEGPFGYNFVADFEGKEDVRYKWIIGDEIVDKENYDDVETDHQLYWQFSAGTYTVCIISESDLCPEGVEFCEEITVAGSEGCPDMEFSVTQNSDRDYTFVADFEGIESLEWYGWFIDGELVENEGTTNEGDNTLNYVFTEGTYEVCIMTETPDCPEGTEYCKEIVVEFDDTTECVQMNYVAERDGDALAYNFEADFEGRDNVTYIWAVYINDDYQGGEERIAGSGDDHNFYWQFEPGVVYEVCLRQDGQECIEFQKCQEFVID